MKLICLIILLTLISCGKKNKDPRLSYVAPNFDQTKVKFRCESGDCPEYIAFLFIKKGDEAWVCTGSLFNKKYILTNSHCTEKFIDENDCSSINAYFKTANGETFQTQCEDIIYVNKTEENLIPTSDNDFSVFRLKSAPPLKSLNVKEKSYLENEDNIVAYVTDYRRNESTKNERLVDITKLNCQYRTETYLTPTSRSHHSPIMTLDNCGIIGGNSGSPIISENGKFAGLVYAGPNDFETRAVSKSYPKSKSGKILKLGLAISAHCIDIPELNEFFPSSHCQNNLENHNELFTELVRKNKTLVAQSYKNLAWSEYQKDYQIQWEFDEKTLEFIPQCIKSNYPLSYKGSAEFRSLVYSQTLDLVLNEKLIPEYVVSPYKKLITYNLDIKKSLSNYGTSVRTNNKYLGYYFLNFCNKI